MITIVDNKYIGMITCIQFVVVDNVGVLSNRNENNPISN